MSQQPVIVIYVVINLYLGGIDGKAFRPLKMGIARRGDCWHDADYRTDDANSGGCPVAASSSRAAPTADDVHG